MKAPLIIIATVFALSGAALAHDKCSDRAGYCNGYGGETRSTKGLHIKNGGFDPFALSGNQKR